ncbi:MAG TPA: ATP-binding protein [Longimicrobiaceae bacterium]|nr:ATP-binding protein [Longimicrobiaceae bacterium]
MRISTRLALVLGASFAVIMLSYAAITLEQRVQLLRDALIGETETLASTLRIVTDNAVRDRRFRDLDRVFQDVVGDPETIVAAVTDDRGRVLAGGATGDPACLRSIQRRAGADPVGVRGWADCGMRVRWVALPADAPAARVLVARRASLIEREVADTRLRLSVLTVMLAAATALIVHLLLRRTLSLPLGEILRGIRALGGPHPPEPIRLGPGAGELQHLAETFNAMVTELDARERRLVQETEERVALERRLREAEKFAVVGRVSGGLAHELGSPLAVIAMRADAVATEPGASEAARRNAEGIAAEVKRITQLIEGLLHVGRRRGIRPAPVDLREVVAGAVEQVDARARAAGVELEVRAPEEAVVVHGQATLLSHVMLNLLRNAVQAMAAGPGAGRRLTVAVERSGSEARVVVEDNGPGIAPGDLAHVFEPFYTTKDVGEGTGLGLAVSRGIVEEHGGSIALEAPSGGGVRATVSLPAGRVPAAEEVHP